MNAPSTSLREHALAIWHTAVDAVRPRELIARAFADPAGGLRAILEQAPRILVIGGGKAGAAMSAAIEEELADLLPRIEGIVNVPAGPSALAARQLQKIRLHAARPAASNQPTAEGVAGVQEILRLAASAGPGDVALCLISGGGSALMPAPVAGTSLEDKQCVTRLLHACGATINEMNAVRKHLSAIKGGRLAQAFTGKTLVSLIISDVIGDPLDVIASGPTAADPTTFAEALAILDRYQLRPQIPASIIDHLQRGEAGEIPETPKTLPDHIRNLVIGNNALSLAAAHRKAEELGYQVLNLGSYIEGETQPVAVCLAGIVRSIREQGIPITPPACVLSGGETTVTLAADHGKGGRNQEFVLAALAKLGADGMRDTVVLSGGSDGEDGPTDAAGAVADEHTLTRAQHMGLNAGAFLAHNDAYRFFEATGDLLITGLTQTNVMDVRVLLIGKETP